MTDHFVFMSYRAEIGWIARLARVLESRGIASELWVVDPIEEELARATGAFARIVDLRGDFRRTPDRSQALTRETLQRARELEDSLGGGPFLHREAGVDRVLTGLSFLDLPPIRNAHRWSWEDTCRLSLVLAETVRARIREDRPRAVVGEVSLFASRVVGRVVEAEGVPFLSPMNVAYLPDRVQFADGMEGQWQRCIDAYHRLEHEPMPEAAEAHARETLQKIRAGSTLSIPRESVSSYLSTPRARFGVHRLTNLGRDWRDARAPAAVSSPHSPYPELLHPGGRLVRKARRYATRTAFDREAATSLPDVPFAAYFIHSQPEVTVEGWAPEYQDQVAVIRNIAACLPADLPLVVKEHRVQAGWRDPSFYRELYAIPGVLVTSDTVPSSEVVRRAELVLTLTGTISLEAMCVGVPAVVLGSVYYEHFAGIQRPRSYDELRSIVAGRAGNAPATDAECLRALAARFLASHPGGWMSGGRTETDERVTAETLIRAAAAPHDA